MNWFEVKDLSKQDNQMTKGLAKPVIITNYATAKSQLNDGVDGIIVQMDNEGCSKKIKELILDFGQFDVLVKKKRITS